MLFFSLHFIKKIYKGERCCLFLTLMNQRTMHTYIFMPTSVLNFLQNCSKEKLCCAKKEKQRVDNDKKNGYVNVILSLTTQLLLMQFLFVCFGSIKRKKYHLKLAVFRLHAICLFVVGFFFLSRTQSFSYVKHSLTTFHVSSCGLLVQQFFFLHKRKFAIRMRIYPLWVPFPRRKLHMQKIKSTCECAEILNAFGMYRKTMYPEKI